MRINQNISAMNTYSKLTNANTAKSKSLEKLSSGLRINRAGDDAAGLAISEKMRGQISGLNQGVNNAQDAISLIQTAEGALSETHSILQRMRELAVQSSNDTNTGVDRSEIQKEMNELIDEVDRISNQTQFNTQDLLNGTFTDKKFHIGANSGQNITLNINSMTSGTIASDAVEAVAIGEEITPAVLFTAADELADPLNVEGEEKTAAVLATEAVAAKEAVEAEAGLGIIGLKVDGVTSTSTGGIMSSDESSAAIDTIQSAIELVSAERSKLGATQNRLDHTINNLTTTSENLVAAESRIRDVDMAKEMMDFTKNNILSQAATSMLAQANQMPQSVLQLLQ